MRQRAPCLPLACQRCAAVCSYPQCALCSMLLGPAAPVTRSLGSTRSTRGEPAWGRIVRAVPLIALRWFPMCGAAPDSSRMRSRGLPMRRAVASCDVPSTASVGRGRSDLERPRAEGQSLCQGQYGAQCQSVSAQSIAIRSVASCMRCVADLHLSCSASVAQTTHSRRWIPTPTLLWLL